MIKASAGTPTDTKAIEVARELLAQDELKVQKTHGLFSAPSLLERVVNPPTLTEQRQRYRRGQQQERRWPGSEKRRRC
jgi:hypothetical protein